MLRPVATDKASEFIEAAKKHPSSPKFTNAIAQGSWTLNTAFGNLQLQSGPCFLGFKNGTLAKGMDGMFLNQEKQESLVKISISGTIPGDWYFIKIQASLGSIDELKIYSGNNFNANGSYFSIKAEDDYNFQYPFTFQATEAESYMEMRGSGGSNIWFLRSVKITKMIPQ
ncbi:MAG: hypothetical protein WKF59_16610 [Chitinophagaceae bacterium]